MTNNNTQIIVFVSVGNYSCVHCGCFLPFEEDEILHKLMGSTALDIHVYIYVYAPTLILTRWGTTVDEFHMELVPPCGTNAHMVTANSIIIITEKKSKEQKFWGI